MRTRWLWCCILCTAWPLSAAAEDPRGIRVVCDDGERFGAALLMRDFRQQSSDGLLLLTALHVLQGCRRIEPLIVGCTAKSERVLSEPWSADHPVEVLSWSAYDLVAIVIPAAERAALSKQIAPAVLTDKVDTQRPPYHTELTLVAKSGVNVCPRIPAITRDIVTVADLYESLDLPDYQALFGSLSSRALVISYESTAVGGASGGPLFWLDRERRALIALHLGGQASILQWGLLLSRDLLRSPALARLDPEHPAVAADGFSTPLQLTQPSPDLNARLDLGMHSDDLSALFEASTPVDPFGAVSNSLQLGWTHQWVALSLATSFGTRLAIAGMTGLYRSPVFDDHDHIESALRGTAKLPFIGGFVETDAELTFARLSPVHYAIGLGLRLGVSHLPDVEGDGTHFSWGPITYGRLHWRWTDRLTGLAQLHLTVVRIPADKTPLDCVGPSVPAPETWDVWGGIAVGVGWKP